MKQFRKSVMTATAALFTIALSLGVSAANIGRPACLYIDTAQVDTVTVIDRELYAGYMVAGENDRKAVIQALNGIDYRPSTNVTPDMDGLRLLQIRFQNGEKYEYWCHRNVLMNGDTQLTDGLACADLYKVLDRCIKNNPASIEWLSYMNPYRVTSMEIGGRGQAAYQTTASEASRKTILDVCGKLQTLVPSKVRKIGVEGKESFTGKGELFYTVALEMENGKSDYLVKLFDNGEINISVDNISYSLAYTSTDQKQFDMLITTLRGYTT
ncbi:hypothetical protein [Marasmitruncus massiliensis]|uniref:hypothetical protein n=1 Tax=Marasmitruncus massiliensis TaxID=1944642 RepID=UPI000C7AF62E|nr:hypothetical protein [Marasmitruncus massiliensis]